MSSRHELENASGVMDGPMSHVNRLNTAVDCMMDGPMAHVNTKCRVRSLRMSALVLLQAGLPMVAFAGAGL
jgi:hypothetical protein